MEDKIITVGLSPCWDKTIEINGINWNQHKIISSQKISPAGKAFNINKALAWLGVETTAAGLWGSQDYKQMQQMTALLRRFVKIRFTKGVPGSTRQNITIIDTAKKRQIHLRSKSTLANTNSLKLLKKDLQKIITKNSFCIFAGAMPDNAISLIESAKKTGAAVVIDTSGPALKKIVAKGGLYLIKPNVEELAELAGRKIKNEKTAIISAAKKLLNKSKFILVSRAEKGAILICKEFILSARYIGKKYDVYNTVGCGDFLLAGFLSHFCQRIDCSKNALEIGVKAATAKAFGLNEKLTWRQAERKFKIATQVRICPK
jgi:1-phosphofructokinase family hexose kinase